MLVADPDGVAVIISIGVVVVAGDETTVVAVDGIGEEETVGMDVEEYVGVGMGDDDGVRSACCFKQSSLESDVLKTQSPIAVSHNCVIQSEDTMHKLHSGLKHISSEVSDPSVHFEL